MQYCNSILEVDDSGKERNVGYLYSGKLKTGIKYIVYYQFCIIIIFMSYSSSHKFCLDFQESIPNLFTQFYKKSADPKGFNNG